MPAIKQPVLVKIHSVLRYLPLTSLQSKLIIPYVVLTLLLATAGTYIVSRLVTSSVRERFINQLYEAGRVASDGIVRQEQTQLENLRLLAFLNGMPDALKLGDATALEQLAMPILVNNRVEILAAIGPGGREIMTWGSDANTGQYIRFQGMKLESQPLVQNILSGVVDDQGDKYVGLFQTYFGPAILTSAPVRDANGGLAGVLVAGVRLDTLLASIKSQALADVIILDSQYQYLATTLPEAEGGYQVLEEAARSVSGNSPETPRSLVLNGREFQFVFSPLTIRQELVGSLGIALSGSYIVSTEATSRNALTLVFTLATLATIIIGYFLSQSIARPILKLRSISQAVAAGDLSQSTGFRRSDEIGELAEAFDQMTLQLHERTEEAARLYAESIQRNKELAQINQQLQMTQQQLIQSEKLAAVGQLTAGIVHDVKNPLAVIKGLADLLKEEEGLTDEAMQELNLIHESAVKANRIVTDLLKFARQSTPEMKYGDLRETIDAALRLNTYLIREAHVQVVSDLPEKPVVVIYDAQQIEQVFVNLIHNAIQAMPKQGTLRINLSQVDGVAAVAFQDTGVGIPPENLGRIFDPFFTTKPAGEGTGLGLSVSYGIISCHRGRIEVESRVGEGTTFTILLPASQEMPEPVVQ